MTTRRQLVPFAALSASYFAHIGFFNPYLPLWLKELGLSILAISVLVSVQAATRLFAPYGWGWLLKLAAELERLATIAPETAPWRDALRPLAEAFADRFLAYLPRAAFATRAGVHSNSAFALLLALDWCEALLATGDVGPAAAAIDELGRFTADSDRLRAWHTCFAGQLTVFTAPQALQKSQPSLRITVVLPHSLASLPWVEHAHVHQRRLGDGADPSLAVALVASWICALSMSDRASVRV